MKFTKDEKDWISECVTIESDRLIKDFDDRNTPYAWSYILTKEQIEELKKKIKNWIDEEQ